MEKEIYAYIREKGPIEIRRLQLAFVGKTNGIGDYIESLIQKGYIEEKNGLLAVTQKGYDD